jgi:hypothetical protein
MNALGPARGPRGEHDVAHVIAAHLALERRAAGQEARRQRNDEYAGRSLVLKAEKPLLDQHGLGPAAADDVPGLGRLEPRVDRNQHPAGGQQAERCDDPLGRVRRPDRHAVALLDAGRGERARGDPGPAGQLGERQPGRPVHDRLGVAEAIRRALHHLRDGLPGHESLRSK